MIEVLGILLIIIGTIGTVIPILPGSPIALVGFYLIAWQDDFTRVGWVSLSIITALTILGQVLDVVATHYGVKKAGASKYGIWGALIGVFVGIFLGPFGILLGPMIGAIIGELINQKALMQAGTVGVAAGMSIIFSMIVKLLLIGISFVIFAIDFFNGA